jgi:hypothetical protein
MSVNFGALTQYVNEQKIGLIRKSVLGAKTINYVNIQTGVVGPTAVNLLDTTIQFGNGAACGWNEAGASKLSQRVITPAHLKVNMSFCDKQMAKYWMNHEVRVAAGQSNLPFEETFVADVVAKVNAKLDDIIWNGVEIGGTKYKGYLDLLTEASVEKAATGATVYETVKNVYNAIDADVLDKASIFVGVDTFRALVGELTEKNMYHYNPTVDEKLEIILPGTVTKVIAVPGLNGKNVAVAGNAEHMFYGTDMTGDEEVFDLWYSKDNQEFRLAINFAAGVQFAFPDQVAWADTAKGE